MRELNRLGVTGVIDAGGGFQNYPDDYAVIQRLADDNQMTVRLAYNLFTQKPKQEKEDFLNWTASVQYKQGTDYFRHNGAGEMLVFSAADFEDFRVERPDMPPEMEGELEEVVRVLAQNRWPWRLHATYDETIARALDVFEKVHRDTPLTGLNWFFDHAETISDKSIDRIAALGGGIAVQHRMAYQGEYFIERYGAAAAEATPPVAKMLARGVKVSAGTDATRVASYNPGCPCPGWSPARPSAARASIPRATAWTAKPRCACGPRTWPGSPTRKASAAASSGPAGRLHRAGQGLFQLRRGRDLVPDLGPDRGRRPRRLRRRRVRSAGRQPAAARHAGLVAHAPVRRLRRLGRPGRRRPQFAGLPQHGGLRLRQRLRRAWA